MNFQTFKERIASLKVVYSIRDKVPYRICSIHDNILTIQRESTKNYVKIKLDELYEFYTKENKYTTTKARIYISGYVYSPAVAVINELEKRSQ